MTRDVLHLSRSNPRCLSGGRCYAELRKMVTYIRNINVSTGKTFVDLEVLAKSVITELA